MKSYKMFIIKAIAFVVLLILIDLFAGLFFRYFEKKAMNNNPHGMIAEYTMWQAEADIMIFGASEVHHSIIPSLMKAKFNFSTYNCAADGMPFYYQYCMINSIIDRKKPKIIIWSVLPYLLKKPTEKQVNALSTLNPFYNSNTYCKNVIDQKSKFENLKMLSNLYQYNSSVVGLMQNMIVKTKSDNGYLALSNTGYKFPKLDKNSLFDKQNEVDTNIVNSFVEIINKCNQSNVQLVLVFAPRHQLNDFSNDNCYRKLKEIANANEVPFIEKYFSSNIFLSDSTLFKDNAHLNDKGARLFTNLMSEEIQQIIITNN